MPDKIRCEAYTVLAGVVTILTVGWFMTRLLGY